MADPHAYYLGNGQVSLGISEAEIRQVEDTLRAVDGGAERAITSAINDTLRYARTQLGRRIRDHLNLPLAEVRDRITIKQQATGGNLVGVVSIDYRPVPLEDFKARFRAKSGGGVVVKLVRSKGAETFKHMFRATMQSGHTGIFERNQYEPKHIPRNGRYAGRTIRRGPRKGQPIARQSISERVGPSILGAFEKAPNLADEALADIEQKFQERLASKIEWQLSKARPDVPDTV